jgi:Tfp pilus assembly protein PilF
MMPPTSPRHSPADIGRRSRWFAAAAAITIVAAIALAYRGVTNVPFLFDDYPGIERNASIRHLWPLTDTLQPPVSAAGAAGRPVVNLTLALNYAAGGLHPAGYHITNVALHVLVALLLFAVVAETLRRTERWRQVANRTAAIIAGTWAIHPLPSESVICVIQRNELLTSLFLLGTLYGLIRSAASRGSSRIWEIVSVASCLLGMASKETMVGAPLIALLYDRTFLATSWRAVFRTRWRYHVGLAATWLLLAVLVFTTEQRAGTVGFGLGTSSWTYLVTQAHALTLYLQLCVWPHPLVLDYGFYLAPGLATVWPQAVLIVAALVGTIVCLRRMPAVGFLGACFFILLAPSSSIMPLTTQTIAEHRMYLPAAAVIAGVILVLGWLTRPLAWPTLLAVIPLLAVTTARVEQYRTEKSIWTDVVAKQPGNARAWSSLAHVAVDEQRWDAALALYEKSIALRPDYADTQNDYANVLLHEGRITDALAHYRAARRLKPRDNDIQFNFAGALAQAGDGEAACENLKDVLSRDPKNARAWNNLGDLALKLDRTEEALAAFTVAVKQDPDFGAAHNNAAVALMRLGRYAEAVPHYEAALRLMGDSALIHHNLALALDGAGRWRESADQERAALRSAPDMARAREHLAELERRITQP